MTTKEKKDFFFLQNFQQHQQSHKVILLLYAFGYFLFFFLFFSRFKTSLFTLPGQRGGTISLDTRKTHHLALSVYNI